MKKMINWLKQEESGQGMVEYGLILALVSVVVIAILGTVGDDLINQFTNVANAL